MDEQDEETEFDFIKAELNLRKHKKRNNVGLSFEEAAEVFEDEFRQEKFDDKHSTLDENRFQVIGRVKSQLVVFVVYQAKDGTRRIISARPALERERKFYYEQIRRYFEGM